MRKVELLLTRDCVAGHGPVSFSLQQRTGHRAVASLRVPSWHKFQFPHSFVKFQPIFGNFPPNILMLPTWKGPGYATDWVE